MTDPRTRPAQNDHPIRVLIVEDDVQLRQLYVSTLAAGGYQLTAVADGIAALQQIDIQPPDLVVLDLGLPRMHGRDVAAEIRAHAHTRDVPIVIVTGLPGEVESLGESCVLRKPVDPARLFNTVRDCLRQYMARKLGRRRSDQPPAAT